MTKSAVFGLSRRETLLGAAAAVGAASFATPALVQSRRKVIYTGGSPFMPYLAYTTSIPLGAGFFAEEGLDVEFVSMNGAVLAANALAGGQGEFNNGAAGLFGAVDNGARIQAFMCQACDNYYELAVDEGSTFKDVTDLKGKIIGVNALGGGIFLMLRAVIGRLGWTEGKDIHYIAVGTGLPALDALRRGRVQALFLWDEPYSAFAAVGAKLRFMKPAPLPSLGFASSTNTRLDLIEKEPELVAKMARALGKSICFYASAHPDEITRNHYKHFPESRLAGQNEEIALRAARLGIEARASFMRLQQRVFSRQERIGDETDERIEAVRDVLLAGGALKKKLPASQYFTRSFLDYANNIDIAAIIAKGKAYRA